MQECEVKMEADALVLGITCEIDHHTAKRLRETIDPEILGRGAGRIVLDFSRVSFMDSSGIGLVMGRYRLLQKTGSTLSIVNLPENIYKIMKLAGIERLASLEKRS